MLTELEKDVLSIIKDHVGYITQHGVTQKLGIRDISTKKKYFNFDYVNCRQVRKIIAKLIMLGYPIISTPKNGGGYCWMNKGEEGLECAKRIQRQAVKLFLKARKIRENSRVSQLSLV